MEWFKNIKEICKNYKQKIDIIKNYCKILAKICSKKMIKL